MLLNHCFSYAACVDTLKACLSCRQETIWSCATCSYPPTVCYGCDSGSCLSGQSLNVTRPVDTVLGDPREDALVDTACEKTDYSSSWECHSSGGDTQTIIYQLQYCTAPIIISSQPSRPSRTTTILGSSQEAYFPPLARPSRHSRRHKPPSWRTWQHRRVQQVRDHEQRPLSTLQTISAPLRPLQQRW